MARLTTVLFDLDGTLLPMDQDVFARAYFTALAGKAATRGYEPETFVKAIWKGTYAMMKNDGSLSNEKLFWRIMVDLFGDRIMQDQDVFDNFYRDDFDKIAESCGHNPAAATAVHAMKDMGLRVALATNPLFPAVATQSRIRWAGLDPTDFELYTTYEDYSYCKPSLAYYETILERLGVSADECLMVGNDVGEDMVAEKLGMRVFLLSDCIINKHDADISAYPQGSFDELLAYVRTCISE
jgi:FMN phosphatase YigB (HAD superfamily)